MARASSLKRSKTCRVEKVGGRNLEKTGRRGSLAERRTMPEGSGTPSRGRLRHRRWTTMAQKLGENFSTALISSFRREDEPPQLSASDQEAMCLIPASRNSGGPPTMWGVGQGNGSTNCWWRKSVRKMHGFWNTLYSSKSAISLSIIILLLC